MGIWLDDLGIRTLPLNAAQDLLEIVMRRYQRASTIVTSPGWAKSTGAGQEIVLDSHSGNSMIRAIFQEKSGC